MTYSPNTPNPANSPATDQPQMSTNAAQADTVMAVDHYEFSDTSGDAGKHRKMTLVKQSQATIDAITIGSDEIALYAKESNSLTEIFTKNSSQTETQVTKAGEIYLGAIPAAAVNFDAAGNIQGTALNVTSVTKASGKGRYTINIAGGTFADDDYLWSIQGMGNTLACFGEVTRASDYTTSVTNTTFSITYPIQRDNNEDIVRGSVVLWKVQ